MQPYIGIRPFDEYSIFNMHQSLRKELLLFDAVCINHLLLTIGNIAKSPRGRDENVQYILKDLQWLLEQGLLIDDSENFFWEQISSTGMFDRTEHILTDKQEIDYVHQFEWMQMMSFKFQLESQELVEKAHYHKKMGNYEIADSYYNDAVAKRMKSNEFYTRFRSMFINFGKHGYDFLAVPIVDSLSKLPNSSNVEVKKTNVFNVVLNNIPIPDETNPWEAILDFKKDTDTVNKFRGLRVWVSEIARTDLNVHEVEDKFLYNLEDYKNSLKAHRLKTRNTFMETVILPGAEFIENIIKLEVGKLLKPYIDLKKREADLLESELNIKYKELAYINKVHEKFKIL